MTFKKAIAFATVMPLALVLTSCAGTLQSLNRGVQNLDRGVRVTLTSPYNNLDAQWHGRAISDFQKRFGAPSAQSSSNDGIVFTWQKSAVFDIPADWQTEDTFIGNTTITRRIFIPEHDAVMSCTVLLTAKAGKIARVKTTDDWLVPRKDDGLLLAHHSACQTIFGP